MAADLAHAQCQGCETPSACALWRACLSVEVASWAERGEAPEPSAPACGRWPLVRAARPLTAEGAAA
jgi:hypothetical protein